MSNRAHPLPSMLAERAVLLSRAFAAFERSVASREWLKASLQAASLLWEIERQGEARPAPSVPAVGNGLICQV